ncbi:putative 28S rRNA (cytosine-C(5))-methyltransferase, partial [Quaeritorhiza haematococci]
MLKSTPEAVLESFSSAGYKVCEPSEDVRDLEPKTIRQDFHIPNLLVFPSGTDLHDHPSVLNGSIILQDKASCFPAHILNPPRGSYVIDACAAPGNKTSHLSSIMRGTGKIYAFDADKRRLQTLRKLCDRAGCTNIDAVHQDFLKVDPTDPKYKKVEYILLDPSCSGSGIVNRLDHLAPTQSHSPERLSALSSFQYSALLHAFSFPNVKRVVYSTCSKFEEENEEVVRRVLEAQDVFGLAGEVFPGWKRRGFEKYDGAENMIRTVPEEDGVIGFFVA